MTAKPVGPTWRFRVRHGNTGRWRVVIAYAPTKEAGESHIRAEWPTATVFYIDAAMQRQIDEESRRRLFARAKRRTS